MVDLVLAGRIGVLFGQLDDQPALFLGGPAGDLTGDGVLVDLLGHDVARAGQRVFDREHLCAQIATRQRLHRHTHLLRGHQVSQRLQAALAGDHGPRAALGLVGQVEVFDLL